VFLDELLKDIDKQKRQLKCICLKNNTFKDENYDQSKVSPIARVTTYILYLLTMLFDLLIDTFHDYILVIEVVLTNMALLFKCFFYYISLTSFK
jgi:hypothetical protein